MLKIFTWHIHGSYLYYLSQCSVNIYIPVTSEKNEGYYGRGETFPFGNNVIEVPFDEVKLQEFDCILFQTNKNFLVDQYEVLSDEQRALPKIYLEHDPPWKHPTNTKHLIDDPNILLVHVTHFNRLMWDNNQTPTRVISHGVTEAKVEYNGELNKGIVVINNLPSRGRLLGLDIFLEVRKHVPIDLVGMGTGDLGLGEVLHPNLPQFISKYRFFFNPIRYTSLGLAVCEALMLGIPVVGMATTEMATVIKDGHNGFCDTDIYKLIDNMKALLNDKQMAVNMGKNGKETAIEKFSIERFTREWHEAFSHAIQATKTINLRPNNELEKLTRYETENSIH